MRPFVLTRQAETALQEIARWTAETFGPRQARRYGQELIDACTALADGRALSRPCRRLIDPALPEDLRFARVGRHFIVFIDAPDRITVVDVLHVRADLPRRLAALGDDTP
ncbi:type II toxin-antitoxin system RelE/ParE family toxin [Mameliella alba]|uniref:type II toxin-antitoxin system RelE/ParE family toxin n=1 Tax=Mameliella alba TaxID=561184 RepID=UPI001C95CAA9|nr:type II toxin-antitoxin system RelE/ParE family toxin [Mameliella alba]MBY6120508.1 type II toxin-antitoxin system RelE/ParE family toxin [Mameliella alba]